MRRLLPRRPDGRLELGLLSAFLVLAALLFAFGQIADEVIEGESLWFDETVLLAFRGSDPANALGPAWLESAVRDVSALGSVVVLSFVSLAAVLYLIMVERRAMALFLAVSICGGVILSNLLKLGFARARPEIVPDLELMTYSFPSGHATLSAVTYLTLGALLAEAHPSRRVKLYFLTVAFVMTVAIGLSRVYLGVHFPTDVLAGWCIGAAWAVLCGTVVLLLRRRAARAGHPV
jgi:undecaprenyl-diphosphatase